MGEDLWKVTAEMYSSLISKPKMNDKLLKKPPFRFLHDVIMATMAATGYPQGLFTEQECDSANVTERDAKTNFLEKIIQHVSNTIGEQIAAKPSKIVAGQEWESTNIFLQGLYRAATGQYQKQALPAEEPRAKRKEDRKARDPEEGKANEEAKAREEAKAKEDAKNRAREEAKQKAREEAKAKEAKAAEEAKAQEARALEEARKKEESRKREEGRKKEERPKKEEDKKEPPKRDEKGRRGEEKKAPPKQEPPKEEPKAEPQKKAERPTTAGRRPPKNQPKGVEEVKGPSAPTHIISESNKDEDEDIPITSQQPSKTNPQYENIKAEEHGKFVREAMEKDKESSKKVVIDREKSDLNEDQGKKIKLGRIGGNRKGDRPAAPVDIADIDTLKTSIQKLVQSTNPLGKSMDFVNDDIESMKREYEKWKNQYIQANAKMEEQKRITEDQLQPLYDKLAEVEESIKEKQLKINHTKAQILKNENLIRTLLQDVVSVK
ncbi:unnamed protein product [Blepharisma stoltei]|uniref:TRAF3-interacting protein 1 n=1 Tax=Blepharisma stoltei TaxID=1481888 RepID=A0AAU9KSD7_9CILI|nr:unnamed protein product [Blepharisma stoltei]